MFFAGILTFIYCSDKVLVTFYLKTTTFNTLYIAEHDVIVYLFYFISVYKTVMLQSCMFRVKELLENSVSGRILKLCMRNPK